MSEQICEPEKYSNVTCLHGCGTYTVAASEHCRVCNKIMADGVDDQAVYCSRCGHNAKTHGMWEMSDISRACIYPTCRCLHFEKGACFEKADDIELQLLIVDFGDSCAVKVEKGDEMYATFDTRWWFRVTAERPDVVRHTFSDVRVAIDAMDEKPPYPCLFARGDESSERSYAITDKNGLGQGTIQHVAYDILSELAGHPLPIFEPRKGGEWAKILGFDCVTNFGFTAWRYTRRVK